MSFLKKILFSVLLLNAFFFHIGAQSDYEFKQLFSQDMYPNSITYAVRQDSIGDIWIASEEGILKYNSHTFVLYNTQKGLPASASNRATEIFIDSRNRLWAGLEKGVCLFDLKEDYFHFLDKGRIQPKFLSTISEDGEHNIWFSSSNGLWKYTLDGELIHVDKVNDIKALSAVENKVYFATSSGLYYLDIRNNAIRKIVLPEPNGNIARIIYLNKHIFVTDFSGKIYKLNPVNQQAKLLQISTEITKPVFDIITDKQGNYFVATNGEGLFYFNPQFELIRHFVNDVDNPASIKSNGIYDLEIGNENILWIATYGGGLNYLDLNQNPFFKIKHITNDSNSIMTNVTTSIEKDKKGRIWFGTSAGISIWDRKKNQWKHIRNFLKNADRQTIIISLEAGNDYMWAGSYGAGLFKINLDNYKCTQVNRQFPEIELSKIYAITQDDKHNIWLGGINHSLKVLRKNKQVDPYPVNNVKVIVESVQGKILTGSKDGLSIIDDATHSLDAYTDIIPKKKASHTKINTIAQIDKNNLVLGTGGGGLVFFNTQTHDKRILDVNKGLSSNIIQGIILQNPHNLWVSTSKGINHIITRENDTLIYLYDKNDNLAENEYITGSYLKINDSLFAFGSIDGVTLFNPYLIKEKALVPTIVLDKFELLYDRGNQNQNILKKHINQTEKIKLASDQNSFVIKFTGIHLRHPSKIKYTWMLKGFSDKWSTPDANSSVNFTNLDPGIYTFKVKALNRFGDASPEKQLIIEILPPWWATKTAFGLFFILAMLLIYFTFWFYKIYLNKKHSEEQITFFNNITHELKTPLIVLLSSLEKISKQFDHKNQDNKYLIKNIKRINSLFEQMLNYQRVAHERSFVEEINEINVDELLHKIIDSFKPLIEKRGLQVIVHNKWGDKPFYFNRESFEKILQNLLSNAIKYSHDKGKIYIHIKRKQHKLILEVTDEGIGIPKDQQKNILKKYFRARNVINSHTPGTGLGLMMIKKLIDQVNGKISFVSEENKGSKFIVQLKSNKTAYKKSLYTHEKKTTITRNQLPDKNKFAEFKDRKILIVEDNAELRNSLKDILQNYFEVFTASNGEEGLEKAMEIVPDIILTDLIMPKMDGIEMAKRIQMDNNLNHIPIFMMTVMAKSNYQLKSIEAGIDAYIEKPLHIDILLSRISNALQRQNKLKKRFQQVSESEMAYQFRNQHDQEFIDRIRKIILDNLDNNAFSVNDITAELGMSRTSLYLKLKKIIDMSPQDLIVQIRLEKSKQLLIEGDLSIKQIAYSVGFSNSKYFSTVFKKYYGLSPTEFLKSLKDK